MENPYRVRKVKEPSKKDLFKKYQKQLGLFIGLCVLPHFMIMTASYFDIFDVDYVALAGFGVLLVGMIGYTYNYIKLRNL